MEIFQSILQCPPLSALGRLFVIIECCKNRKVDIFLYIFIYFHLNESSLAERSSAQFLLAGWAGGWWRPRAGLSVTKTG